MKSSAIPSEPVHVGFQIAPMIDVVFVIMLFFMVMAASLKHERQLKFALPGPFPSFLEGMPMEIEIGIAEDGVVIMNEEEYDSPVLKDLPDLSASLARLGQDARESRLEVLVTVRAEEHARYERVIDVLNATSKAGFRNVTFVVGGEGQG